MKSQKKSSDTQNTKASKAIVPTKKSEQKAADSSFFYYGTIEEICKNAEENGTIENKENNTEQPVWEHATTFEEFLSTSRGDSGQPRSENSKTSETFGTHSRVPDLAEKLRRDYLDQIPAQEIIIPKLLDIFHGAGLSGDNLEVAANVALRSHLEKITKTAWSQIPSYKDEKVRLKHLGEKWNVHMHYDAFWRPWENAGLLFRDYLRSYDANLVKAIQSWCSRNDKDPENYLPPTQGQRVDEQYNSLENLTGLDAVKVHAAHRLRKYN